jgi:chromosome segregation ATPase
MARELALAEEQRTREVADAARSGEAALAETRQHFTDRVSSLERALAATEARTAEERVEAESRLGAAVAQSKRAALAEAGVEHARAIEAIHAQTDEALRKLEASAANTLAEANRAFDDERHALMAREEGLARMVSDQAHELEMLRKLRGELKAASVRADGFEALVASHLESIDEVSRELEQARAEVPELKGELAVLRAEVSSLRRKLDDEAVRTRAATEQLDRNRALLERARTALAEVVAETGAMDDGSSLRS